MIVFVKSKVYKDSRRNLLGGKGLPGNEFEDFNGKNL